MIDKEVNTLQRETVFSSLQNTAILVKGDNAVMSCFTELYPLDSRSTILRFSLFFQIRKHMFYWTAEGSTL